MGIKSYKILNVRVNVDVRGSYISFIVNWSRIEWFEL